MSSLFTKATKFRVDNKEYVDALLNSVFRIYTTRQPEEQMRLFDQFFAQDAIFEDPIMLVKGRDHYRLQFLSLIKLFSHIEITVNQHTVKKPGSFGEGTADLIIENQQHYEFGRKSYLAQLFLPEKVDLKVRTTLTVVVSEDEAIDGRVLKHQDVWPESSAFQNSFYQRNMKPLVGTVMSNVFKLLGW